MKTFRRWNKQDSINGASAEYVIESHQIRPEDEVFLVVDEYGNITQIEKVINIKSAYKLDPSFTLEQTAQAYLDLMVEMELKAQQDQVTLEGVGQSVDVLKQQNADLTYALMMGGLL